MAEQVIQPDGPFRVAFHSCAGGVQRKQQLAFKARIQKFFENNLNISETARQLYVHRNTLVYRLERLEKAIGLDIRKFDDAMTFKIAMMVIAHMNQQKVEE